MVQMPYKFKRDCPVCGRPELLSLSDHLRQVHRLKSYERKQWLKAAVFSGSKKSLGIKHKEGPDVYPKYCTRKRKEVENENELLQLSKKRKNLSIV